MNIQALKDAEAQLAARNSGGAGFISTKDIGPEGLIIRLMPDPPILNGLFYFEVIKYWMTVNGKRTSIICASTFGKKSVMQEEIDEARMSDDEDVQTTVNDTNNKTAISKQPEAWMAVLQLKYTLNGSQEVVKASVVDKVCKVFQCSKQPLLQELVKLSMSRKALAPTKGSNDGIADRIKGTNILITKTGKEKQTRYKAELDEIMEMDAAYYTDIPNVYEIAMAQMKNPSYQRAAVRNHLYGEEIPQEVQDKEDARAEKAKELYKQKQAAIKEEAPAKPAKKKAKEVDEDEEEAAPKKPTKKPVVQDDDDIEDTPAPKKSASKKAAPVDDDDEDEPRPAKKSASKKASILDDEDEEPAPKTSAKRKAAVDDDDDMDEEEAPAKPAKKNVAPAPKPAAGKRSILDDIDDDDLD